MSDINHKAGQAKEGDNTSVPDEPSGRRQSET